jgi:hypothetical protein
VRECRSKPKKEQAHVAQDEEEASLMPTTATLIHLEVGVPTVPTREVFYRNFGSRICGGGDFIQY